MVAELGGREGWWIMDSCAKQDPHKPMVPYVDEPCATREEAKEICDMLNETEADPRVIEDEKRGNRG
jgi:hypothetical protein